MNKNRTLTLIVALMLVASFGLAGGAYAQIKLVAPLNAWDRDSGKWENGNVQLWSDPDVWVPFHEELNFDNADFDTAGYTGGCVGPDTLTPLAGELEIGLYHTDNSPAGAPGFQATRNWMLLDCTLVEAASDPISNPFPYPPSSPLNAVLTQTGGPDAVEAGNCGGNCTDEIVNRFFISLDSDCDGASNAGLPARVCLYWEAQPPGFATPVWGGNVQARISSIVGGASVGDKTLNFSIFGPTVVAMRSFAASSAAPAGLAIVAALAD